MRISKYVVLIVALLMLGTSMVRAEQGGESSISYRVNILVNKVAAPQEVPPYIVDGTTMVPLRFVSESLGATVQWDGIAKEVMIQDETSSVYMKVGAQEATVQGGIISLEKPAVIKNDRVMVPLRFVSTALGAEVGWDGSTNTVYIDKWDLGAQPPAVEVPEKAPVEIPENIPEVPVEVPVEIHEQSPGNQAANSDEMRAVWISTVYNIDWPSKSGLPIEKQQAEFIEMLDEFVSIGINTVFVQVRAASDAIYDSDILPWSQALTGVQGVDPGYDPLAFMIEEAHKRNLQLHAWFNPFRASLTQDINKLALKNPARINPNWVVIHEKQGVFDPGIPEVRKHIIDAIMEVVKKYDIDGVHMDDYFYPYGSAFADEHTYNTYNHVYANKGDWRRNNINTFVRELHEEIKREKSDLTFGISPFGIWRNQQDDPTGSLTAGNSAYDRQYVDARTWIRNGWVDYIAPQLYWNIGHKTAAYDILVEWWANEVKGTSVDLYIGHAIYRVGSNQTDWQSCDTIIDQLRLNKTYEMVRGSIFFSANVLMKNTLQISDSLREYYSMR